jgi:hypothetical protein
MKKPSADKPRVSGIRDFVFDQKQHRLAWTCEGTRVEPDAKDVELAMADPVHDLIFALESAAQGLPGRLHVFAAAGTEVAVLDPPEGFQFYYLTPYEKLGVAVVCVTAEPVEGWRDWHFGFDPKTRKLFRHAPAH